MKSLLYLLVLLSVWGCENNYRQERLFKSASKHIMSFGSISSPILTTDEIHYFAEKEFDKHPEYDSLYVNIIPALPNPRPAYTVIGTQIIMFHFCSRKMIPSPMVTIQYDSLKQDVNHLWQGWN